MSPRGHCAVCGARNATIIVAREMMFGTRERYRYAECAGCGVLERLDDVPDSVAYPPGYFSFRAPECPRPAPWPGLAGRIRRLKTRCCIHRRNPVGSVLRRMRGEHFLFPWFRMAGVTFDSRILDVGCGAGHLLLYLQGAGFRNLTGADPLLAHDLRYGTGVVVYRRHLAELSGAWDFIMLNHVLEHLPDPFEALARLRRLLADGGHVLIRTPLADSKAYATYRENWAQIDAPRHLLVHTARSVRLVAEKTGFIVERVEHDSTAFQFIASEQHARDIATFEPRSWFVDDGKGRFTGDQVRRWEREAARLNTAREGDSAGFLLRAGG